MATIGELSILINLKGLSTVKKSLGDLTDQVDEQKKSIDKVSKASEESFKLQEKQVNIAEQSFKRFNTEIKTLGTNFEKIAAPIRNIGLAITGGFTAAFLSSKGVLDDVNKEILNIEGSFKQMSVSISSAALPTLKQFSSFLAQSAISVQKFASENKELLNSILKFGGAAVVFASLLATIGHLLKQFTAILGVLKTIGVITNTGAISTAAKTFGGWTIAVLALVEAFKLLDKGIGSAEEQSKRMEDNLSKLREQPDVKRFLDKQRSSSVTFNKETGVGVDQAGNKTFGKNMSKGTGFAGTGGFSGGGTEGVADGSQAAIDQLTASLEEMTAKSLQASTDINAQVLAISQGFSTAIGGTFESFTTGIGQAVAQSIVSGQNFMEAFKNVLKQLATDIIAMLVSVIAKVLVLRALGVVGPIPAAALFGGGFGETAAASPGGKGIGGFLGKILPFADGGIVTKPTLGLVGEAGPEAIVPLDQMGQMGGGNTVVINSDVIFTEDSAAVDRFVRQIQDGILRSTRRRTGGTAVAL